MHLLHTLSSTFLVLSLSVGIIYAVPPPQVTFASTAKEVEKHVAKSIPNLYPKERLDEARRMVKDNKLSMEDIIGRLNDQSLVVNDESFYKTVNQVPELKNMKALIESMDTKLPAKTCSSVNERWKTLAPEVVEEKLYPILVRPPSPTKGHSSQVVLVDQSSKGKGKEVKELAKAIGRIDISSKVRTAFNSKTTADFLAALKKMFWDLLVTDVKAEYHAFQSILASDASLGEKARQMWAFTKKLLQGNVRPAVQGFSLLLEAALTTEVMLLLLPQITLLLGVILTPFPSVAVYTAIVAAVTPIVAKTIKYVVDAVIGVLVQGFSELYDMRHTRWVLGPDGLFIPVSRPGSPPRPRRGSSVYHPSH